MVNQLVFATHNDNKVKELNHILPASINIVSLKEIGWDKEIEEPHFTLEDNAKEKAMVLHKALGDACFAEDSGLFIDGLDGAPGVFSARYAAKNNVEFDNMDFVLQQMIGKVERTAHFKTVICFAENNTYHYFTGICEGQIMVSKIGSGGFGYDPIFMPTGANKTFGEMTMEEKNKYSHRKKATDLFITFLEARYGTN